MGKVSGLCDEVEFLRFRKCSSTSPGSSSAISLDEEITNMQATLNELMVWYFAFNFVYD
jgi:hypothetical protein